jgi:hypothetical protein
MEYDPDLPLPPDEIIGAAEKIRLWMESKNIKFWRLGGICDRRIADEYDDTLAMHKRLLNAVENAAAVAKTQTSPTPQTNEQSTDTTDTAQA